MVHVIAVVEAADFLGDDVFGVLADDVEHVGIGAVDLNRLVLDAELQADEDQLLRRLPLSHDRFKESYLQRTAGEGKSASLRSHSAGHTRARETSKRNGAMLHFLSSACKKT